MVSQIFAATSGPLRRAIARMPVGDVTLISVRLSSITSMPTNKSPRFFNSGASVAQISRSRGVNSAAWAAPPRTMLERRSSACGTRLTAPANSPSTRMIRLSPCFTAGGGAPAVAAPRNPPGDQDDPFAALLHGGEEALDHPRLAEGGREHVVE